MTHVTTPRAAWHESVACLERRALTQMGNLYAGGYARLQRATMTRYTHSGLIVRFGYRASRSYSWRERELAARHVAEFLANDVLPSDCWMYVP
jgi:hypothetical protein